MKSIHQLVLSLLLLISVCGFSQSKKIGEFTDFTHIGNPAKKGIVRYNDKLQEYTLEGASGNMWFDKDDFHFLWKKMKGNFILQARIEFIGKGVDPHRKVGLMIRQSLDANAAHANAVVHGDGLASLQYRRTTGAITEEDKSSSVAPDVLQLERKGNTYIVSLAKFGEPYATTTITDLALGDDVYAGLFICSHNEQTVEKAILRNVRVIIPAKDDLVQYREYIGSHLEIMDIEKGHRKIIYSEPVSLQAPNWTQDNKSLIYNRNGLLYRFDLKTRKPTVIPTDFADKNNNDHVLSFDGKMIGISHHGKEDNGSSGVYIVPIEGGKPQKITTLSPSYLHSWSPDGKYLVYTGGRNNEFDIYKIPVTGGEEIKLTDAKGLEDGPEFTPDGKYIYFNSVRSGTMQIWRMKPDGSEQEQITHDEFNNWFPHISPDGKWIAILSFMQDVPPAEHPFYKRVYLRVMPISGGTPRVVAYVYGGQGTINVPSWSPDSKYIAFVSNSTFE